MLAAHMGAILKTDCSTSGQLPDHMSGKAAKAGPGSWALELTRETWKKLRVPGFGLGSLQLLLPFGV